MKRTFAANKPASHAPTPKVRKPSAKTTRTKIERALCVKKGRPTNRRRAATPHRKYNSKPPAQARGATKYASATKAAAIAAALMKAAGSRATVL